MLGKVLSLFGSGKEPTPSSNQPHEEAEAPSPEHEEQNQNHAFENHEQGAEGELPPPHHNPHVTITKASAPMDQVEEAPAEVNEPDDSSAAPAPAMASQPLTLKRLNDLRVVDLQNALRERGVSYGTYDKKAKLKKLLLDDLKRESRAEGRSLSIDIPDTPQTTQTTIATPNASVVSSRASVTRSRRAKNDILASSSTDLASTPSMSTRSHSKNAHKRLVLSPRAAFAASEKRHRAKKHSPAKGRAAHHDEDHEHDDHHDEEEDHHVDKEPVIAEEGSDEEESDEQKKNQLFAQFNAAADTLPLPEPVPATAVPAPAAVVVPAPVARAPMAVVMPVSIATFTAPTQIMQEDDEQHFHDEYDEQDMDQYVGHEGLDEDEDDSDDFTSVHSTESAYERSVTSSLPGFTTHVPPRTGAVSDNSTRCSSRSSCMEDYEADLREAKAANREEVVDLLSDDEEPDEPEVAAAVAQPLQPVQSAASAQPAQPEEPISETQMAVKVFNKLGSKLLSAVEDDSSAMSLNDREYELLKQVLDRIKPPTANIPAPPPAPEAATAVMPPPAPASEVKAPERSEAAFADTPRSVPRLSMLLDHDSMGRSRPSYDGGQWSSRESFLPPLSFDVTPQKTAPQALFDARSKLSERMPTPYHRATASEVKKRSLEDIMAENEHESPAVKRSLVSIATGSVAKPSAFGTGRYSYTPSFMSNAAVFAAPAVAVENKDSLSYIQRRRLQRESLGTPSAETAKRILEGLSELATPAEIMKKTPVPRQDFLRPAAQEAASADKPKSPAVFAFNNPPAQVLSKKDSTPVVTFGSAPTSESKPASKAVAQKEDDKAPRHVRFNESPQPAPFVQDSEFQFGDPVVVEDLEEVDVDASIKYTFSPANKKKRTRDSEHSSPSVPKAEEKKTKISAPEMASAPAAGSIWSAASINDGLKCPACLVKNKKDATKCASCESSLTPKPSTSAAVAPAAGSIWAQAGNSDTIKCNACYVQNKKGATKCASCESPLAGAASAPAAVSALAPAKVDTSSWGVPAPKVDGAIGSSGFTFAAPASTAVTNSTGGFTFGSAPVISKTAADFSFTTAPAPVPAAASSAFPGFSFTAPTTAANDGDGDDEASTKKRRGRDEEGSAPLWNDFNAPAPSAAKPTVGFLFSTNPVQPAAKVEEPKTSVQPFTFGGEPKRKPDTPVDDEPNAKKQASGGDSKTASSIPPAPFMFGQAGASSAASSAALPAFNAAPIVPAASAPPAAAAFNFSGKSSDAATKPAPFAGFGATLAPAASASATGLGGKSVSFGSFSSSEPATEEKKGGAFNASSSSLSFGSAEPKPLVPAAPALVPPSASFGSSSNSGPFMFGGAGNKTTDASKPASDKPFVPFSAAPSSSTAMFGAGSDSKPFTASAPLPSAPFSFGASTTASSTTTPTVAAMSPGMDMGSTDSMASAPGSFSAPASGGAFNQSAFVGAGSNPFASNSAAPAFGGSAFGSTPAAASSVFGGAGSTPAFGSAPAAPAAFSGAFGAAAPAFGGFGGGTPSAPASSSFAFGATAPAPSSQPFGSSGNLAGQAFGGFGGPPAGFPGVPGMGGGMGMAGGASGFNLGATDDKSGRRKVKAKRPGQ